MLLVIISVMTATILTMSYLSSRDNSAAIGENAADASAARWSALAGLDIAIATLETESDWRAAAADGTLLDDYAFLGGDLTVHIVDADTGEPPTQSTILVNLIATFDGGNITQTAEAFVAIDTPSEGMVQVDLADFAIFADEQIMLRDGGVVTRWEHSPRTTLGLPIPIGIRATTDASIRIGNTSAVVDGRVHHYRGADSGLIDSSQSLQSVSMQNVMPLPAPPPHGIEEPESGNGLLNLSSNIVLVNQMLWDLIDIQSGRLLHVPNDSTIVVRDEFRLRPNSRMSIGGDTTLVVFGDFRMDHGSFIELAPDATLRVYVEGNLTIDEAYIGGERADSSVLNTTGTAPWMNPNRIQIFSFSDSTPSWNLDHDAVVIGNIYAPPANIEMRHESAVYGRIAARNVVVRENSSVYYDHTLDRFSGFANTKGLLFDGDGNLYPTYRDMVTVDTDQLNELANDAGLNFSVFDETIGSPGSFYNVSGVSSGDATPRPVRLDSQLLSVGIQPRTWE